MSRVVRLNQMTYTWAFLFLIFPLVLAAQNHPFSPENIKRFADYLYAQGDYLRAAGEYQRYLLLARSSEVVKADITYRIGICFRQAKNDERAILYFQEILDKYEESEKFEPASIQIAFSLFLLGKNQESLEFIKQNMGNIRTESSHSRFEQLAALNHLFQKNWKDARSELQSLSNYGQKDPVTLQLSTFINEGQRLPHKSPFLAGLLSAVVPGSGKIYGHRSLDGIVSFLTVTATTWQAYRGFQEDGTKSVRGWIFGTMGAFFYLGNIYGSVVAVNLYNHQVEKSFFDNVGISLSIYFR